MPPNFEAKAVHEEPLASTLSGISDRKYTNLEILRILAAALVVFLHLQQRFALELHRMAWLNDSLRELGAMGVDLFFVISGFVIALNIDRGDTWVRFTAARVRRILPLYWSLTMLAAVVWITIPSQFVQQFSFSRFLSSLFFVSGEFGFSQPFISLGWTLDLEMRFYLIVAIAIFAIPATVPRFVVPIVAFLLLVAFVVVTGGNTMMYEFGFGFAVFAIHKFVPPQLSGGLIILMLGLLGIVAWVFGYTDGQVRWVAWGVPSFLIVLGAVLIPQVKSTFVKRLGFASYSTYLTQWFTIPAYIFVIAALGVSETFAPVFFLIGLVLCVAAGVLYSMVVDERLYALSKKIRLPRPKVETDPQPSQ